MMADESSRPAPRPPRILVLRGGAIGDFVLTLPALQALRRRWPDAHIELVGYPHIVRLAEAGGLVQRIHSLDRAGIARFFALYPQLEESLQSFIASFDIVLSYLHDPDGCVRLNLLSTGVRHVLYISPVGPTCHASDHLLKPLESLAIYESGLAAELVLAPSARSAGGTRLARLGVQPGALAVHAGSGSPQKIWPVDGFIEVARRAAAGGRPLLFLLGEADAAIAPRIHAAAREMGIPVLEDAELVDVAGVLANCGAFVGNDSGITHLAAALNLAVVGVFGPTDAAIWAPRGPRVRIVQSPDGRLDHVTVDQVMAALADTASP